MFSEAAEAPAIVAAQLARNAALMATLAASLRARQPRAVVTIARGSSDNAATYARYLLETRLGVLTASAPPSVNSVYGATLDMADTLVLAFSQSGRSPDLLAASQAAASGGARVVALVNDEASPLAELAGLTIPLAAGAERSVAATKSFIAALSAVAQLVAYWSGDDTLKGALGALPGTLKSAWALDWSAALAPLTRADHLYVIGRGTGLAVAQEAALKLKETCGLHAEAFSAAEIRHGPMALVGAGFPVLAFVPSDESRSGVEEAVAELRAQGATVLTVGGDGGEALPMVDCHPLLLPLAQIQALYRMVDALAALRGHDPDAPPHLAKVTETL
ncbi:MAG TPA: SIS domain-containing protein [Allosphingosinicella sp.]|jgi:glucosamine--fructose-6-phosphate aminotransferase (isomerizing)|nr:SIS domain-containing protein [Allosphingosinicella sp.]